MIKIILVLNIIILLILLERYVPNVYKKLKSLYFDIIYYIKNYKRIQEKKKEIKYKHKIFNEMKKLDLLAEKEQDLVKRWKIISKRNQTDNLYNIKTNRFENNDNTYIKTNVLYNCLQYFTKLEIRTSTQRCIYNDDCKPISLNAHTFKEFKNELKNPKYKILYICIWNYNGIYCYFD